MAFTLKQGAPTLSGYKNLPIGDDQLTKIVDATSAERKNSDNTVDQVLKLSLRIGDENYLYSVSYDSTSPADNKQMAVKIGQETVASFLLCTGVWDGKRDVQNPLPLFKMMGGKSVLISVKDRSTEKAKYTTIYDVKPPTAVTTEITQQQVPLAAPQIVVTPPAAPAPAPAPAPAIPAFAVPQAAAPAPAPAPVTTSAPAAPTLPQATSSATPFANIPTFAPPPPPPQK